MSDELKRVVPAGNDPAAILREQNRLKLRKDVFSLRERHGKLMALRSNVNAPEDLAQQIRSNTEAMKAAQSSYDRSFASSTEERLFKNKHFIATAEKEIAIRSAQIELPISQARRSVFELRRADLLSRVQQYQEETAQLRTLRGGEDAYAKVYKSVASPAASKQEALRAAWAERQRTAKLTSLMSRHLDSMTKARFAWNSGKFGFGRKGAAGLEEMRKALLNLRAEGKDLGMLESRFTTAELRTTAAAMRQSGIRIGRSIAWKGLKVVGAGALTAGGSNVVFAAEMLLKPMQVGCDNMRPFYLGAKENCSPDYSINSSNADVLFSDSLAGILEKEDDEFHCFVRKNWEERFAKWKFTCKPGMKDQGMFKTKIYGKRADGQQFYFAQTADPKMISASITNQKFMTQALEASTCCMDSNPRISDRECANYGIAMAPRVNATSKGAVPLKPSATNR